MAGKHGSASIWLLVDGYNLISAKLQSLRYKLSSIMEKSDGCGDLWDEHTPVGKRQLEVAQEGAFFDTSAGNIHAALSGSVPDTPQDTVRIVTMGFAGSVIGQPFLGCEGAYSHSYEVLGERDKLQRANVEYTVGGVVDDGVVLHELSAETGDDTTEDESVDHTTEPGILSVPVVSSSVANPSIITTSAPHRLQTGDTVLIAGHVGSTPDINGEHAVAVIDTTHFSIAVNVTVGGAGGTIVEGKTNAGGAGYLEVTALTLGGYTSVTVAIRDSDDDITFADLVSFAVVTAAPEAQRVTVSGAVERYLAQSVTFNGAGAGPSITYFAGFARY